MGYSHALPNTWSVQYIIILVAIHIFASVMCIVWYPTNKHTTFHCLSPIWVLTVLHCHQVLHNFFMHKKLLLSMYIGVNSLKICLFIVTNVCLLIMINAFSLCRKLMNWRRFFDSGFFNYFWRIFMMTEWRWKLARIITWALTFF